MYDDTHRIFKAFYPLGISTNEQDSSEFFQHFFLIGQHVIGASSADPIWQYQLHL